MSSENKEMEYNEKQKQVLQWIESGCEHLQGTMLYRQFGKNIFLKADFHGKQRKYATKIIYELCKSVGLHYAQFQKENLIPVIKEAIPLEIPRSEKIMKEVVHIQAVLPVDIPSFAEMPEVLSSTNMAEYPPIMRRIISEYAETFQERSKTHRILTEMPQGNSQALKTKCAEIFDLVKSFTIRLEYLFKIRQQFEQNGELPLEDEVWPKPKELPDWGAKINLFSVGQERNFNFVTKMIESVDCVINEFFIKPQTAKSVPVDDLVDLFCDYYKQHPCQDLFYYWDRYSDHRQPNVKNSKPYNEQAIERLEKRGWRVFAKVHKGMEPPQHDKYLLWLNILKGSDPRYPKFIINGRNCKFTIISMNNTRVTEKEGKFAKDKSSERRDSILPEEATHFGDAVDKRVWTKYGCVLYKAGGSTFVSPRI